jgi:hypothetical protein
MVRLAAAAAEAAAAQVVAAAVAVEQGLIVDLERAFDGGPPLPLSFERV